MNKNVIYLGYRIDEPRCEAVTINAVQYRQAAEAIGYSCEIIAYDGTVFSVGKLWAFLRRVGRACKDQPGIIVHDFFVMPGLSLIIRTYLAARGIRIRYIKTFINPPGTASLLSVEGFLRLVVNNRLLCKLVMACSENATYFQPLWSPKLKVLDTPLRFGPGKISDHGGPIRVGYLGHPLRKKGVHLFPKIIAAVNSLRPGAAEFRFSFSELSDVPDLETTLAKIDNCSVTGPANPHEFFGDMDVYLLPIENSFAASGSFNTVYEAMACGCCVLTADLPALPALLTNEAGVLVTSPAKENFTEALVKLIGTPDILKAKQRNALDAYRLHYEGLGLRIENQLKDLYEQRG